MPAAIAYQAVAQDFEIGDAVVGFLLGYPVLRFRSGSAFSPRRSAAGGNRLNPSQLNWIANFIWGIADDVLRDLYVRGKYRDVILPMTVLRRLDAVLELAEGRRRARARGPR